MTTDANPPARCPHCFGDHDGCTPSTPRCSASKGAAYITLEEMERIEAEATDFPMTDHRGATLVMRFTRDGQPWAMTREQRCAALRVFFKLRTFAPLSVGIALPADDWRGFAPRGLDAIRSSRTGYRYCYELAHPQDAGQAQEVRS